MGALSAGYLMELAHKRTLLLVSDVVMIIGSALSLIDNMYVISVGRFFFGVSIGHFSVFCPSLMNDLIPPELKGPMGPITSSMVNLGVLVPFIFGWWIPEKKLLMEDLDSFYI